MNKKNLIPFGIILLVLLAGAYFFIQSRKTEPKVQNNQSSSQTNKAVLLTAKEAYNQLASEAHRWQNDAVAYKLEGGNNRENVKVDFTEDGKSSSWKFWFLSPSQKEIRVYYFKNNEPHYYPEAKGVSKIVYEASDWSDDWQIDSNKAFEIAKKEGIIEPLMIHLYLKNASFVTIPKEIEKFSTCKIWWEIWGKDQTGTANSIYIEASSGSVLKK